MPSPLHRIAILVASLVLFCGTGVHADRRSLAAEPGGVDAVGLSPRLRSTLEGALVLARAALEERPACQALFEDLGADGLELLARAEIRSADGTRYDHVCERGGSSMVTSVSGRTIAVCRDSAARLDRFETAARLLHEVLHHAGLSERPHDPDGLWPEEITRRVKRSCSL